MAFERLKRFFSGNTKSSDDEKKYVARQTNLIKIRKTRKTTDNIADAFRQNLQASQRAFSNAARQDRIERQKAFGEPFVIKRPTEYKSAVGSVSQNAGYKRLPEISRVIKEKEQARIDRIQDPADRGWAEMRRGVRDLNASRKKEGVSLRGFQKGQEKVESLMKEKYPDLIRDMEENPGFIASIKRTPAVLAAAYDVGNAAHPNIYSALKGMRSGMSFGLSDVVGKAYRELDPDSELVKSWDEYEKNKTGWQTAGEVTGNMAGSMLSFGLTSAPIEQTVTKGLSKIAPNLSQKASTKLAQYAVTNPKVAAVLKAIGTDATINLTTGALSDITHALADSNSSEEFLENLKRNTIWNWALSTPIAASSGMRAYKRGLVDGVDDMGRSARNVLAEQVDDLSLRPSEIEIDPSAAYKNINTDDLINGQKSVGDDLNLRLNQREKLLKDLPEVKKVEAPRQMAENADEVVDGIRMSELPESIQAENISSPQNIKQTIENVDKGAETIFDTPSGQQIIANTDEVKAAREATKVNSRLTGQLEDLDKAAKEVSDDAYAASQSYTNTAKTQDIQNRKRIFAETERDISELRRGGVSIEALDNSGKAHKIKGEKAFNESVERAYKNIETNGLEKTTKRLEDLLKLDAQMSGDDAITAMALKNLYKNDDGTVPKEISDLYNTVLAKYGTQQGQGLRLQRFIYNCDPQFKAETIRRDMVKFAENVCGQDNAEELFKTLKTTDGKSIGQIIDELANFSGSQKEFSEAYAQLQLAIYRKSEPNFIEMMNMWRHTALLGNFTTMARNMFGNIADYTMSGVADKVQIAGDKFGKAVMKSDAYESSKALFLKGDNRKIMYSPLIEGKVGTAKHTDKFLSSFADQEYGRAVKDFIDEDVASVMSLGNKLVSLHGKGLDFDFGDTVRGKTKGFLNKALNKTSGWVRLGLEEADSWAVEQNYKRSLANYFEANDIHTYKDIVDKADIVERARAAAIRDARQNTFKEASELGNTLSQWRRAGYKKNSSLGKKARSIVLDAVLPYDKVPINVAKESVRYSPIGLAHNSYKAYSAIRAGDARALQEAMRGWSKGVAGTALVGAGIYLRCKDQMDDNSWGFVAKADDDLKDYGIRDYSLKIGNKNISLANIGPGATQLLMGAYIGNQIMQDGGLPDNATPADVMNVANAVIGPFFEMSIMQNANDLITSLGQGDTPAEKLSNAGAQILTNYVGQYNPGVVRSIARGTTSADLDTGIKKGGNKTTRSLKRGVNQIISGIPVVNEKVLPHKVNAHGKLYHERPTAGDKAKKVAQNLFDPFSVQTVNIPKADKEALSVGSKAKKFDQNKTYQIKIGADGNSSYKSTKETFDLTGKEREQVGKALAKSGKDAVNYLVKEKDWFGDSASGRAQSILKNCPADEEKACDYLMLQPEYKKLSKEQKKKFWDDFYEGRDRTTNHEYYVDVAGNTETHFEFKNDLTAKEQQDYEDIKGIVDEATYLEAVKRSKVHTYSDEKGNGDKKLKSNLINQLLAMEGLSTEQRKALYNTLKNKNWKAWDGKSGASTGKNGYGRKSYGSRRSSGSSKPKTAKTVTIKPPIKASQWKATKQSYKSAADAVRQANTIASKGTSVKLEGVKIKPPTPKKKRG